MATENKVRVSNNQAEYYSKLAEGYKNQAGSYATAAGTSATLAANWATKTDGKVDANEYSAKYYAQQTQSIYSEATSAISEATVTGTIAISGLTTDSISIISTTTSALKTEAINTINSTKTSAITNIENIGASVVSSTTSTTEAIKTSVIESTTTAVVSATSDAVGSVNNAKTSALNTISGARTESLSTIGNLKTSAINTIDTLTTEATTTINSLKTQAVNTINSTKTAYIAEMTIVKNQTTQAKNEALIWAEGSDSDVQALGGTHSAKEWCLYNSTVNQNDVRALQGAVCASAMYVKGDSDSINTRLDEIIQLAHSTFDRSKFTIIGSPVITDNGIASGFSSSDSLSISGITDLSSVNYWEIITPILKLTALPTTELYYLVDDSYGNVKFSIQQTSLKIAYKPNDESTINKFYNITPVIGNTYQLKLVYNNGFYSTYVNVNNNGFVQYDTTSSHANVGTTTGFQIARFNYGNYYLTTEGTLDLKHIAIIENGIQVFSGNKTGIDTVKPDDYTVVGTPTISAEGIYSIPTSSSNYITCGDFDLTDNFEISFDFNISNKMNYIGLINIQSTTAKFIPYCDSNGMLIYNKNDNGTDNYTTWGNIDTSKNYVLKITGDSTNIKFSLYYNGTAIGTEKTFARSSFTLDNDTLVDTHFTNTFIPASEAGTIDFNSFKIYVNGDLVYQPCLKIPYTEGQNYVKVVDKLYRDRVKDLFEQEGYNIYYTLGENDFTLPSNKPDEIVKYKANGLTVAEQRADQTLTIRGACEQGVDVNLPMEFFSADSYAVFGVGTIGTPTASKFTPAADGNYIAIGKGKV